MFTMKKVVLLSCIFLALPLFAQEFSSRKLDKLNSFGIETEKYDLNDFKYQNDFRNILKLNRRFSRRKSGAIVLGSFGLLSCTAGIIGLVKTKDQTIGGVISGVILTSGILEVGGAIPIFISSKHKKGRETI